MIVRFRTYEFINLAHAALGERLSDGGMRIYMVNTQPRDLPPDDADRLRRRLRADIDPEPLPGEPTGPIDAGPRTTIIEEMSGSDEPLAGNP